MAAAGGLSEAETAAAQIEVDAALEAINRIGATTGLGDVRLLDGSAGDLQFLFAPDPSDTVALELPVVRTSELGGSSGLLDNLASGGSSSLASGDLPAAAGILDDARSTINAARGSLGAFSRFTIDASRGVLAGAAVNVSAAISSINDTDVASETAHFVRAQLLKTAAIASVGVLGERTRLTSLLIESV